jgi:hypothetical protein
MLLQINPKTRTAIRLVGKRLKAFKVNERHLQDILFRSLDRLLPDDELLVLMQSKQWQEEPDILALDANGTLYIFELKAWDSSPQNLLQVLRYGQIFGLYKYADLARMYDKRAESHLPLKEAHRAKFEVAVDEEQFNRNQVFVVMTNGLDVKTREAIQYWRSRHLDVRPWIYRVYDHEGEMLLELTPFRVEDNPYEDISEGFYILNTNIRNDPKDDEDMLEHQKAAAYFDPWKLNIERLVKGDVVFLFRSGVGIVAVGKATGELGKAPYHGNAKDTDEEYFMKLSPFHRIDPPVTAAEVKELTGVNYRFMGTMFNLDSESGRKLYEHVSARNHKP